MNILSLLIALPLFGSMAISLTRSVYVAKVFALAIAVLELLITMIAVQNFNANDDHFQLVENYPWIPSLNIHYQLGIDGISILFLPMTALLVIMAILASWRSVQSLCRLHFALLLMLEACTIGVFSALDMVLFFVFWEMTLPPIFYLMGLWGIGPKRRAAAVKYTLFMLFGGVPLLLAIMLLAINHANQINGAIPQALSFSFVTLIETPLSAEWQTLVFLLLGVGFAVKAPLVPFHTWLPTAAMEGPTQITALLTGLKLGVYGILRFAMPLAPSAAIEYNWVMGILGAITLIYGALIALQQSNLRRLLAYASISHVGLVIIGIAALNLQGIQGAVLQLLNFTVIASSLMLIAGLIQQRLGSTEAVHLGGLAGFMPRLTCFFLLFALASIGIPGTNGFPAELLLVLGTLLAHPSLGITALLGAVLSAAYMLSFTRRAFWGRYQQANIKLIPDLQTRELLILFIPALLVVVVGFFPNVVQKTNQKTAEAWLSHLLLDPASVPPKSSEISFYHP